MLRIGEGSVSPLISKTDTKPPSLSEKGKLVAVGRRELGPKEAGPLMTSRSSSLISRGSECKIAGLYDLEDTLGRGHFAVVKLARHVFTGEKVAVKVIDKTKLDEVSKAHLFQVDQSYILYEMRTNKKIWYLGGTMHETGAASQCRPAVRSYRHAN